jgi:hypothetical protein
MDQIHWDLQRRRKFPISPRPPVARDAGNQVPFVQPSLDPVLSKSASQLFNSGFICTAMRKKDVERHSDPTIILDNEDLLAHVFHSQSARPGN